MRRGGVCVGGEREIQYVITHLVIFFVPLIFSNFSQELFISLLTSLLLASPSLKTNLEEICSVFLFFLILFNVGYS